jgi:hypothetical protein
MLVERGDADPHRFLGSADVGDIFGSDRGIEFDADQISVPAVDDLPAPDEALHPAVLGPISVLARNASPQQLLGLLDRQPHRAPPCSGPSPQSGGELPHRRPHSQDYGSQRLLSAFIGYK